MTGSFFVMIHTQKLASTLLCRHVAVANTQFKGCYHELYSRRPSPGTPQSF